MGQTKKVICAKCEVPLEGPDDPKPNDRFSCPQCGSGDTYNKVMAEVGDFVEEQASGELDKMFTNAFRGSKNVTFTSQKSPKRKHRFILG